MPTRTFLQRTRIEAPAESVLHWHASEGALERLTPPWQRLQVLERTGGIEPGARASMLVRTGLMRTRWVVEHREYSNGLGFRDVQLEGPFAYWNHTHRMLSEGTGFTMLEDEIQYVLPYGIIGRLAATGYVERQLARTFAYRHRVTKHDLHTMQRYPRDPLRILISGSSGLVGSALVPFLRAAGHNVVRLVRMKQADDTNVIYWDPLQGKIDPKQLEGFDAVIHLAGENLVAARWNKSKRDSIFTSRVQTTRFLCETIASLERPPRVLLSASALSYYGERGDEVMTIQSAPGTGFMATVCQSWEAATEPAEEAGVRVVRLRMGMVLTPAGGVLSHLLPVFHFGLGSTVGSGKQYVSWISIDDAVGAMYHLLMQPQLAGPVNFVAPNPITMNTFVKTFGRVISRPVLIQLPQSAIRLVLGDVAEEILSISTRAYPDRLLNSGYQFSYPNIERALQHVLGKDTSS